MVSEKFDLLILGAGLSGSISAWLAAREGLSVLLVDPLNPPHRLEGLSPRLHHWLQQQGLLEGIGDALLGPFERTSYWEKEPQTANQEWVVSRPALDFHLHRKLSEIPGVYLHQGSGRFTADGAMLANGNTPPSRYRIDARGRKAMPQRDEATQRGPATIAIGTYVKAEKARPEFPLSPFGKDGSGLLSCRPQGSGCNSPRMREARYRAGSDLRKPCIRPVSGFLWISRSRGRR